MGTLQKRKALIKEAYKLTVKALATMQVLLFASHPLSFPPFLSLPPTLRPYKRMAADVRWESYQQSGRACQEH